MIALERLLLFLLLAVDWAADPALLAPAVQPLASPWCSTENFCPSSGYQREVLQQSRPLQTSPILGRAADSSSPKVTPDAVGMVSAFNPVSHLYVFLSLRR
jgi:hypothetical protein